MHQLLDNQKRASFARFMFNLMIITAAASIVSSLLQYQLLSTLLHGGEITDEQANANDTREQVMAGFYILTFVVSAVAFLRWIKRAWQNVYPLGHRMAFDENAMFKSWFIPFVNLYRPRQVVAEMFVQTSRLLQSYQLEGWQNLQPRLINLWWTFWIIQGIIGQFNFRYSRNLTTIEGYMTSTLLDIVSMFLVIIAAIYAQRLVNAYAQAEQQLLLLPNPLPPAEEPQADV